MTAAVHVAGWTLVHFAWQGTLVAASAALALQWLRHSSPHSRYVVACVALAAMLIIPGGTAWRLSSLPRDGGTVAPLQHRALFVRAAPQAAARYGRVFVGIRRQVAAAPAAGSTAALDPRVLPAVVALWLGGVCLLLARLAGGWWRVQRLYRAAIALPASRWQPASAHVARQLGLTRLVRVVDAAFVDGPLVIGWLQPVVLLPVAALSGLTPEQVRAILAHELAHVRRHDALVNFAQTVAETLLFYHPAVWWLSSRIRTEREHCCDDVALAVSGDAYAYASALTELATWRATRPALSLAATGGPLLRRVTRLLAAPSAHAPGGGITLTLAFALLFIVGFGALQFLGARQPSPAPSAVETAGAPAWRMVFDHPSGQMAIRGFTARDLVRYAYQLPTSRVVGGPAWLDSESFDLTTTVDHIPSADETPAIVRQLLEDRFALRVHEAAIAVPALALQVARADGALGPGLQPSTGECFDQEAWVAAGSPLREPLPQGQRTVFCGDWNSGVASDRVLGVTMDGLADRLRHQLVPAGDRAVVNRTGLDGPFDIALDYFKPAAMAMALTPSLRSTLRTVGFLSIDDALESQLGLKLVETTAEVPVVAIDEIQRPLREPSPF